VKKRYIPLLLVIFLILNFAISPVYATLGNAVKNNGFETGTTESWIASYTIVVSAEKHSGNYSAKTGATLEQPSYIQQLFSPQIPVNLVYNWTYWLKCPGEDEGTPWFLVDVYLSYSGTGEDVLWERTLSTYQTWHFYNETEALHFNCDGYYIARIRFYREAAYSELYIDDVVLYADIPEVSPIPGPDYTPIINLTVPFLFLFIVPLILASHIGKAGLIVGLIIASICLYMVGWMPLWAIFLIGLAVIMLLLSGKGGTHE